MFKIGVIENSDDFSDIHLSIDHKLDFNLIKIVIEHFPDHEIFNLEKIISFFEENPHLKQINSHISFNEGYLKSLKEDKMFKKKKNNL